MEVFALSHGETVEAFNKRLADFCSDADAPVVSVLPSAIGPALVISLAVPEDLPMQFPAMLMPVVRLITIAEATGAGLETILSNFAEEIRSSIPDGATPIEMRMVEAKSLNLALAGYAVATVCLGAIDYEGDE